MKTEKRNEQFIRARAGDLVLVPTPGKFPVKGCEGGYQVRPVYVFAEVVIIDKRGVATYSVRPLDLPGESSFSQKIGSRNRRGGEDRTSQRNGPDPRMPWQV